MIDCYLSEHPPAIEPGGIYGEIGAGKTRLASFSSRANAELILLDICYHMLTYSCGSNVAFHMVLGSALRIPVRQNSLLGVYSFLGDAFNTSGYFREVFRVLKPNGDFLHIIPNYPWATTLRRKLCILPDSTFFPPDEFFVPSLVWPRDDLMTEMSSIGFSEYSIEELSVPLHRVDHDLPEHISIPAKELGKDPHEIHILTALRAVR